MPEDIPLADEPGRLTVGERPAVPEHLAGLSGPAVPDDATARQRPAVPDEATAPQRPAAGDAWDTGMRRWDSLYGIVWIVGLLVAATSEAPNATGRIVAIVAVAAMAPWYLVVGRPHMVSAEGTMSRRAVVYMTGIVLLFAIADLQVPNSWFLALAILPQCYLVLPPRRALIPVITMTVIAASSVSYWERSVPGAITAVALAVGIIAFTVAFGGYIGRIITQSGERASLIAQLEATRAQLAEVSREAGAMAERQRLAGDIHDTLAQGFSSILMLIQAADAQLDVSTDTARGQLQLAAQTARENLAEARSLVGGLASPKLHSESLEGALRRITERAGSELGIDACFAVYGASRQLPAATEVVLLRSGQEALANVRKHAAAHTVAVRLSYEDGSVRLEVTDDGTGFDPALVKGGYGLAGMRVRVDEAGGTVVVRSAPALGTCVRVEVAA